MARRFVTDGDELYRAVIVKRGRRDNPSDDPGRPHFLYDGPEYEVAFGPYGTPGAACSMETREGYEPGWLHGGKERTRMRPGVVSTRIERAAKLEWEEVPRG